MKSSTEIAPNTFLAKLVETIANNDAIEMADALNIINYNLCGKVLHANLRKQVLKDCQEFIEHIKSGAEDSSYVFFLADAGISRLSLWARWEGGKLKLQVDPVQPNSSRNVMNAWELNGYSSNWMLVKDTNQKGKGGRKSLFVFLVKN